MSETFFDQHPQFYATSPVGTQKEGRVLPRLSNRWRAIIDHNRPIFAGARVLDIGAHDGRFSLAAADAGASEVVGVEPRPQMVRSAQRLAAELEFSDRVTFREGEMVETLSRIEPGAFDVIMLLGVFYHTMHHFRILTELKRCNPKHAVIDTLIAMRKEPLIRFQLEPHAGLGASIPTSERDSQAMVGIPTPAWMDMACCNLGFSYHSVDWHRLDLEEWDGCNDYHRGQRLTYVLWPDAEPAEKPLPYRAG